MPGSSAHSVCNVEVSGSGIHRSHQGFLVLGAKLAANGEGAPSRTFQSRAFSLHNCGKAPVWTPQPTHPAVISRPHLLGSCSDSHLYTEGSECQCPWGPREITLWAAEGSRPMVFRRRSSPKGYSRSPFLGQEEQRTGTVRFWKGAMPPQLRGRTLQGGPGLAEANAGLSLAVSIPQIPR